MDHNETDEVETPTKISGQKESGENEDINIMLAGGAQQKNPQLKDTTNTGGQVQKNAPFDGKSWADQYEEKRRHVPHLKRVS